MHRFGKYTDIRQNLQGPMPETSLWPTFTDIMTMILMIFMLIMSGVIIKNADLIRQLHASDQEKNSLRNVLDQTRNRLAAANDKVNSLETLLQSRKQDMARLDKEKQKLQVKLENDLSIILDMEATINKLQSVLETLRGKVQLKDETILSRDEEIAKLRQENVSAAQRAKIEADRAQAAFEAKVEAEKQIKELGDSLQSRIAELNLRLAELQRRLQEKQKTLLLLDQEKAKLETTLASERKEHSILEEKYNKLVGPSRSPLGKVVATVQYYKKNGQHHLLFKGIDAPDYQAVTRQQLDSRLQALKDQYGLNLYVKVIIPEDSNLSYNEAWSFTREILTRYDYYYQNRKFED